LGMDHIPVLQGINKAWREIVVDQQPHAGSGGIGKGTFS
jgi:hypothetical protein